MSADYDDFIRTFRSDLDDLDVTHRFTLHAEALQVRLVSDGFEKIGDVSRRSFQGCITTGVALADGAGEGLHVPAKIAPQPYVLRGQNRQIIIVGRARHCYYDHSAQRDVVYTLHRKVTGRRAHLFEVVPDADLNRGVSRVFRLHEAKNARAMVQTINKLPILVLRERKGGFEGHVV